MARRSMWTWAMTGYTLRFGYSGKMLTMKEAEHTFQLDSEPPEVTSIDEYINRDRFPEITIACMDALMVKVTKYDPGPGTAFASTHSKTPKIPRGFLR